MDDFPNTMKVVAGSCLIGELIHKENGLYRLKIGDTFTDYQVTFTEPCDCRPVMEQSRCPTHGEIPS